MSHARIRETEQQLRLEQLPPVEALFSWCAGACALSRHPPNLYAGDLCMGEYAARGKWFTGSSRAAC